MKLLRALLVCCAAAGPVLAQDQSQLGADFAGEGKRFDENCRTFSLAGCAELLFTDHPLHLAVGSLAPQNGFGAGLALVTHYTPNENWRLSWDLDGTATPNGSWRAGAYMTAILIRHPHIVVESGGSAKPRQASKLTVEDMPVFHGYAQGISLNRLWYFGLGQGTSEAQRADFGMREAVVGGNVIWPLAPMLHLSVFAEANGRFTSIRAEHDGSTASIYSAYDEATAPGLLNNPGYAQFGEGIRIKPNFGSGHVQLNYSAAFQEWAATGSGYSFRRLRADLDHQFPLYGHSRSIAPHEFDGPDDCSSDPTVHRCPTIAETSRNLEGSFGFQFLYTASYFSTGENAPFYYDPTIGGSDVNGTTLLASYPDYRFRGPNLLLLRGSFEHSIDKWPLGVKLMLDEGRVALTHGDLGFDHFAHSYAAGLTLHAGGLPVIDLLFAWGGHEGTHNIANISTSLLGGTSRPSLY